MVRLDSWLLFFFFSLYTVLSHLDFSHGKFVLRSPLPPPPGESQLRQSRATQPTVHAGCLSVSIIHRTLDTDYTIFNVRADVNACDCTQGCTDTVRESALKVDSGRKIPCHTRESNLPQRRAGPTFYRLCYIPSPFF